MLAVAVTGLVIASCGDQPSPTVATPVTAPLRMAATSATEFFDMLAEPAGALAALADPPPPVVYPPNSPPSPWPPGPPPKAQPGVPVPTDPTFTGRMHITINPDPVTHSGVPVPTASCATNHPYTWYYDQELVNDTGLALTFDKRENFFDGRYTSTVNETIQIPGNRSVILHTRWCSGYAVPHYAQTRFKGRDETGQEIEISGPWVAMLTP